MLPLMLYAACSHPAVQAATLSCHSQASMDCFQLCFSHVISVQVGAGGCRVRNNSSVEWFSSIEWFWHAAFFFSTTANVIEFVAACPGISNWALSGLVLVSFTCALAFVLASDLHLLSVALFGTASMRLCAQNCVDCSEDHLHGIAQAKAMYFWGTAWTKWVQYWMCEWLVLDFVLQEWFHSTASFYQFLILWPFKVPLFSFQLVTIASVRCATPQGLHMPTSLLSTPTLTGTCWLCS